MTEYTLGRYVNLPGLVVALVHALSALRLHGRPNPDGVLVARGRRSSLVV
jgi:hypothetical protein